MQPLSRSALLLLLSSVAMRAQLPAGTSDASQASPQDTLRIQAAAALDHQDYPTAQKLLLQLTAGGTADPLLLYDLGFTDEALHDEAAAAEAYRRSQTADPNYFEPRLALGLLLARQAKPVEAREALTTAVKLPAADPGLKARAYRALARLEPDLTAAGTDLLDAIKLTSESVDDTVFAAELAERAHDPAAAEAAYRRILAAHADDPSATSALAHLLLASKRAPEAETLLRAALVGHPADRTLTSQLAAAYAAQNKVPEAIALIEGLHAAAPEDSNLTRLLAHLYDDAGQADKAAPLYTGLLLKSPSDAGLLADAGEAQLRRRNYPEAERLLKLAVADPHAFPDPGDYGATAEKLAFAASHNNNPQLVLQALSLRATVLAKSPASLFLAATAHDTLHHRKEASDLYRQFLAAAAGRFPDQEWEASHRLIALERTK